jgi:hypothetical protein
MRIVERTLGDHRRGAARTFFGRLKQQHDIPMQRVAPCSEFARRAEQHRGMRVVAARVHLAGHFARACFARILIDRQRVHVGTQSRRFPRQGTANNADNAGLRDAPMFDAELVELAFDERRRTMLFKPKFRMPMNLAPQRNRTFTRRRRNKSSHTTTLPRSWSQHRVIEQKQPGSMRAGTWGPRATRGGRGARGAAP